MEQMAFDAKALSKTKRQVSWLSQSIRHLLRLYYVQWHIAEGLLYVIYSCATAHVLHVIPSWPPFLRGRTLMFVLFKVLLHWFVYGLLRNQCGYKDKKNI